MSSPANRRDFLAGVTTAGLFAGLGDFTFLSQLPALSADDVRVPRNMVQLNPDIEPLVRLLEETPRGRLMEAAARRVQQGTTYQQLLSALLLAGVRGIRPRPVGYQFHAVLVVNSAHLASMASQDRDRWLPLFWALDNFKESQATNRRESDGWVMPPVSDPVPSSTQAKQQFLQAMNNWDVDAADTAIAGFVRNAGAIEVIEEFWRLGCRDFRSIGHKAIFVANSWRAMQTVGWRHAEPVMRSLAFALLAHEGNTPAQRNMEVERPYRENLQRINRFREGWLQGNITPQATRDFLDVLRSANPSDCCDRALRMINENRISPAALWDAIFLVAGEHLIRQPGIIALHCVTTANAMFYGFQTTGSDETRRLLLLQAAAFMTMFRDRLRQRGRVHNDVRIDQLETAEVQGNPENSIADILSDVSGNQLRAAQKTLGFLQAEQERSQRAQALMAGARRLIFNKGTNSHDYKFSSAALEDFYHLTPHWRTHFLASTMFNLKGSGDRDNGLVARIRRELST